MRYGDTGCPVNRRRYGARSARGGGSRLIGGGLGSGAPAGRSLAVLGLVPLGTVAFDLCLLSPLLGGPVEGRAIRARRPSLP